MLEESACKLIWFTNLFQILGHTNIFWVLDILIKIHKYMYWKLFAIFLKNIFVFLHLRTAGGWGTSLLFMCGVLRPPDVPPSTNAFSSIKQIICGQSDVSLLSASCHPHVGMFYFLPSTWTCLLRTSVVARGRGGEGDLPEHCYWQQCEKCKWNLYHV